MSTFLGIPTSDSDRLETRGGVSSCGEVLSKPGSSFGGAILQHTQQERFGQLLNLKPMKMRIGFFHFAYRCAEDGWLGPVNKESPKREATYFQNHSCDPSTWWVSPFVLTARRDLQPGDEVTYDYGTSECDEFQISIERCLCGSPLCRTQITGEDYLLPTLIERYGAHFQPYLLRRQHKLGLNLDSAIIEAQYRVVKPTNTEGRTVHRNMQV